MLYVWLFLLVSRNKPSWTLGKINKPYVYGRIGERANLKTDFESIVQSQCHGNGVSKFTSYPKQIREFGMWQENWKWISTIRKERLHYKLNDWYYIFFAENSCRTSLFVEFGEENIPYIWKWNYSSARAFFQILPLHKHCSTHCITRQSQYSFDVVALGIGVSYSFPLTRLIIWNCRWKAVFHLVSRTVTIPWI